MAELSVAILGLGRVGTSLGMALHRYNAQPEPSNHFTIDGYDASSNARKAAEALGAFDTLRGNIRQTVAEKPLVINTLPLSQSQVAFELMGEALTSGAVVFDLSALKRPSMRWAAEYLPEGVHLIGGAAAVNPAYLWHGLDSAEYATAELFDGGAFLLAPSASADRDAVALVSQLAALLNVPTHFVDADELDGAVALTEGLPALMSIALFRAASRASGWAEAQRLTNPPFGRHTHHLLDTHPDDLRALISENRDNTLHQLDSLIAQLTELREVVAADDTDALDVAFTDGERRYGAWLKARSSGQWDALLNEQRADAEDARHTFLSGMLGGYLADRIRGKNGKK